MLEAKKIRIEDQKSGFITLLELLQEFHNCFFCIVDCSLTSIPFYMRKTLFTGGAKNKFSWKSYEFTQSSIFFILI